MTKLKATLLATLLMGSSTLMMSAQTPTAKKPAAKKTTTKQPAKTAVQQQQEEMMQTLQTLKQQVQSQQSELESLRQQNAAKDAQVSGATQAAQQATQAAQQAQQQADSANTAAQQSSAAVTDLKTQVTGLATSNAGLAQTISDTKTQINSALDSPVAIHYKGVTITPVGYFAAESVYRTRSINSDINTPFNSTPYPNASQAYTSEFNGSGRQSRLGMRVNGNIPHAKMTGFIEADFLGTGITSNNNQSNSYVLRQRQFWGQAAFNSGFTFTGGQMWSLVTETKHAVDNATENLPQEVDAQYHVGFSWARQYGLRFAQTLAGGKATVAFAIEEPQIVNLTGSVTPPNFFIGNIGTNGGLYNLTNKYTNNGAPDMIVKAAFDPGWGHYEIGGIVRFMRARIYPNQTATVSSAVGAYNDTKDAGGFFANARMPITKYLDFGVHIMGGDGVNRYGTSQLADATIHPNGTLEPLRGYQGLLSAEAHPTKKLDLLAYYGAEYAQRTVYNLNGTLYGYAPVSINTSGCYAEGATAPPASGSTGGVFGGAPYDPTGSCPAQTRVISEGTLGFIYRFYNGPMGRFQYWMTYNYLTKTAWTGTAGAPKATNNMIFTSFRYYLP